MKTVQLPDSDFHTLSRSRSFMATLGLLLPCIMPALWDRRTSLVFHNLRERRPDVAEAFAIRLVISASIEQSLNIRCPLSNRARPPPSICSNRPFTAGTVGIVPSLGCNSTSVFLIERSSLGVLFRMEREGTIVSIQQLTD